MNDKYNTMSSNKVCAFCGKSNAQSKFMLIGNNICVCPDCVKMAYKYVKEQEKEYNDLEKEEANNKLKKPHDIKAYLDEYVIGQESVKERIATAIYNHYKRIIYGDEDDDEVTIDKSNILCLGNSGTGKTYIAQIIAKMLDVPIAITDCSSMSASGYVGADVESCITRLLKAANYDVKKAEMGIVFLDEIDKIATKGENASITRDVSGECVQQELLKIIEGTIVDCNPAGGRKNPDQKTIAVNTKNILFICAGAFVGIDKIIKKRFNKEATIGFNSIVSKKDIENPLDFVTSQDVKKFGMIPELVGRLPIITHTNPLSKEDMKHILMTPKNAIIKQYQKLLKLDGIELKFDDDALDYIVEMTMSCDIGARGLRSIIEDVMQQLMYDLPSQKDIKEYVITLDYVKEQLHYREAI